MREISSEDHGWIEAATGRFVRAWSDGSRPRIEDFLAGVPGSQISPLLEELVRVEGELRRRSGDGPTAAEYRRRFPAHDAAITSAFGPGPGTNRRRAPIADPANPPLAPASLADHPDYEIVRELGQGGMGVVYLAHNRLMRRNEVLKIVRPQVVDQAGVFDRFLTEIRAVCRLRHPNIVTAYSAFRSGDSLVFAMEYVEGLDLSRLVQTKGPQSVSHACVFAYQAALGLQHAHEAGLVHRDIKPGNLMLSRQRDRAAIKVLDFGFAKVTSDQNAIKLGLSNPGLHGDMEANLTQVGQLLGTPAFIAPEQIADAPNADIRADIYSLGCTLYYLLSGVPPFPFATLHEVLQAHLSMEALPLSLRRPDMPAELAALVGKMMAKEPSWRFQKPAEVAEALRPFFQRQVVAPGTPVTGEVPRSGLDLVPGPPESSLPSMPELRETGAAPAAASPEVQVRHGPWHWLGAVAAVLIGGVVLLNGLGVVHLGGPDTRPMAPPVVHVSPRVPHAVPRKVLAPIVPRPRPTPPDPPKTQAAAPGPAERMPPARAADTASSLQGFTRTPRRDWILAASLAGFDAWIQALRSSGDRPVFVNAHTDSGTAPRPRTVWIAAIAVRDGLGFPFGVVLEAEKDHQARFLAMKKQGFQLKSQTTFLDDVSTRILSLYAKLETRDTGFWHLPAKDLPEPFIGDRIREGVRVFSVATHIGERPWHATIGSIQNTGIEWSFHKDLSVPELRRTLWEARGKGFRPESLFVRPGIDDDRFGVVLTRDDPELLWEYRVDLTPAELKSALAVMAAGGYAPDQIVGYWVGGESRYLACWTRDPRQYPVTGTCDESMRPLDAALEQFLAESRIPSATFAVFHAGSLVVSRGFGYADRNNQELLGPNAPIPLGALAAPFAAAAVRSLIWKKHATESAPVSGLLRSPPASGSGPAGLSVGRLLAGLSPPASRFTDAERRAVAALLAEGMPTPAGPAAMTDERLRDALLGQLLMALGGKPPGAVIAAEVLRPAHLAIEATVKPASPEEEGVGRLVGAAAEVGRFFLDHRLDGRPLEPRTDPGRGIRVGRLRDTLGLVLRKGDLLLVVLSRIPHDAPDQLGGDLQACLERAVDSLLSPRALPAKPQ